MIEWLNDNAGAVQGIAAFVSVTVLLGLAIVTAWYAIQTRRIAEAADEQAKAADQPYLLVEAESPTPVYWDVGGSENSPAFEEGPPDGKEWNDVYPKELVYNVYNAGRGPATELSTTFFHRQIFYRSETRDVLRPGEVWSVKVWPDGPVQALMLLFNKATPAGFNQWVTATGVDGFSPSPSDCGVVVTCRDIHGRHWLTYLKMHIDEVVVLNHLARMIRSGEQRLVAVRGKDS